MSQVEAVAMGTAVILTHAVGDTLAFASWSCIICWWQENTLSARDNHVMHKDLDDDFWTVIRSNDLTWYGSKMHLSIMPHAREMQIIASSFTESQNHALVHQLLWGSSLDAMKPSLHFLMQMIRGCCCSSGIWRMCSKTCYRSTMTLSKDRWLILI